MGTVVFDSSVILGLLDTTDAHYRSATTALRQFRSQNAEIVIPATVLSEILVGATRIGPEAVVRVEGFVDTFASEVYPVDRAVAKCAAGYRAACPSLRLPDALVIAIGNVITADSIVTADKAWRKLDPTVLILD